MGYKGKYEDYLKGNGGLSPSGSDDIAGNIIDIASLAAGVRIDDYWPDLFLKHRLWPYLNVDWGLFRSLGWLALAQGVYSGGYQVDLANKDEEVDTNKLENPNWLRHWG